MSTCCFPWIPAWFSSQRPFSALGYLSLLSFGGDKQGIISLGACPAGNSWNQSLVFTAPAGSRGGRPGAHKSFLFPQGFFAPKNEFFLLKSHYLFGMGEHLGWSQPKLNWRRRRNGQGKVALEQEFLDAALQGVLPGLRLYLSVQTSLILKG